jgi:hypothetical protein
MSAGPKRTRASPLKQAGPRLLQHASSKREKLIRNLGRMMTSWIKSSEGSELTSADGVSETTVDCKPEGTNNYLVYVLNGQSHKVLGLEIQCRNDQEAQRFVLELLDETGQAEIWCGSRRVGRVTRNYGSVG